MWPSLKKKVLPTQKLLFPALIFFRVMVTTFSSTEGKYQLILGTTSLAKAFRYAVGTNGFRTYLVLIQV